MKNLKYEVISKARKDKRVSLNMIEFLKKLNSHTYIGQDVNINKEQIAKNLEITKDELNSNLTKLEELGYIKIVKDKDHAIEDRYMINVPHEKITFELLLNLQEKATEYAKDNPTFGNKPTPLFINNTEYKDDINYYYFNNKNWSGGDAIIRQFTTYFEYNCEYYLDKRNDTQWFYHNDSYDKDITLVLDDDLYTIAWYKNRGNTERLLVNGRDMTMEQYIILLNYLQENDLFYFDLTVWDK